MSWRLLLRTLATLAFCAGASAARVFPENSWQAKIGAAGGDAIVANGRSLHLSPGVLVYTPTNSTLVKGAIPVGVYARIQLDMNGDVRRIWVLAADEIVERPWWHFWKTDDIKEQAGQVVPVEQ